ncbi:hypothetical protein D3C76_1772750 [compost metagenome]
MLQQVVHIVDRAGAGVLDRQNGVIRLAGFHLGKDVLEFLTAAFDELIEMAGGVLAGGQM